MNNQNRYSLVVMTHNRPGPLALCLDSIARFNWDGAPPEVLVIDDGSNPPVQLSRQHQDALDPTVVRLGHEGVAAARNAGIKHSSGEFIAFIADDYQLPESYLLNVDGFFRGYPDGQVISHNIRPGGPYLLRPVQELYFDLALCQSIPPEQAGREVVFSSGLPASRAAVFRRCVFERVGLFNENLKVGEDGDFGKRLAAAGIPVYFFPNKRILHLDVGSSADYFRQRLRYGRGFTRAGMFGPKLKTMSRTALILRMMKMLQNKLVTWWTLSGRMNRRGRYLLLSPFLLLFLVFYFSGNYLEFLELRKNSFKDLESPPGSDEA